MKPELSIVITSYRNPALLEMCINSLLKNVKEPVIEIIVSDSATQEDTYDLMREKFPKIKFIPNWNNTGFGILVNQGVAQAEGELVFIINGDIIVKDNESVKQLYDFVKNNKDIGLAGPKLINFDNTIQPSHFRFYTPMTIVYRRTFLKRFKFAQKHLKRFLMDNVPDDKGAIYADWIMGSAMMGRKKVIDKIGEMDTKRFFMYFEDVDWCWRCWDKGFRVAYYPVSQMYHYHGKQSGSQSAIKAILTNKYARIHIASAFKFFLKYLGKKNPHDLYEKKSLLKKRDNK
jgi:GT2 family glycosyltransferase